MGNRKILIIGARLDGHAGVLIDAITDIGTYEIVGFIDSTPHLQGKAVAGKPVLGSTDDLETIVIPADCVHVAIGDNVARGNVYNLLEKRGIVVETIVHPTAHVSGESNVGVGSFVGAGAIVNNGARIGNASIINTGAVVEHDSVIGFAVHMAPGTTTAGRVRIDDYVFVGAGATILPDVHIGSGALIGAGSVVVHDVPTKQTVVGYAARRHEKNIYLETRPDVDTQKIFVAQPTLPEYPPLDAKFREILSSMMLTNFSRFAQEFERDIENKLSVEMALSLPNGTSALMLSLKAMGLKGEVICPSFTFSATGHAIVWNGLVPVFADIDPKTFNIDPEDVERKITKYTCAIMATHIFGNPCDIERLEDIAKRHKIRLIFDAAHALGSAYRGRSIGGFGDVECFSLSGTKVVTSGEGGIVTSNDRALMERIRLGRNYGAGSDYDCEFIGLNGKMSEFHAAIAIESFARMDSLIKQRLSLVDIYRKNLENIPGITFQRITDNSVSTYKDLGILINASKFGIDRNELISKLAAEQIYTKKYFYPPLHRIRAYANISHRADGLSNTDHVADNIICLPLYSHMGVETVERVCLSIARAQREA
jgi:sugar O-acyltransferase (sialic acid O-acetyltransferase NeuD family)